MISSSLPDIILKIISLHLEDIDRISFYLTSKKLYQNRQPLLSKEYESAKSIEELEKIQEKSSQLNSFFEKKVELNFNLWYDINSNTVDYPIVHWLNFPMTLISRFIRKLNISIISDTTVFSLINKFNNLEDLTIKIEIPNRIYSTTEQIRITKGQIPNSVEHLSLVYNANEELMSSNIVFPDFLEQGSIPSSVMNLSIDHGFFKHDPLNLIPSSVTNLSVYSFSITPLDKKPDFPNSLKFLSILDTFKRSRLNLEPGVVPDGVIELNLKRRDWNLSPGSIPETVQVLKFLEYPTLSHHLERTIPNGVEELDGGVKPTCGVLPKTVKKLLVKNFELLGTDIPPTLQEFISFGSSIFNLKDLPSTLTKITTYGELETKLPPCLEHLQAKIKNIYIGLLPQTLKSLVLLDYLEKIEVGSMPISLSQEKIPFPVLPSSIKKINLQQHLWNNYPTIPVGGLPESTEHFILGKNFQQQLVKGIIPNNLKTLELKFDIKNELYIPDSVSTIVLESREVDIKVVATNQKESISV
eukprot:gene2337-2885_t